MTTLTEPTRTDDVAVPGDPSADASPAADRSSAGNGGAAGDGEYAVLLAAFEDEAAAGNARERLSHVGAHGAEIKSIATMRTDACGVVHVKQFTDDSTKTGAKAGLLGGVAAGVLLPPPLLASVVALGMAGAVVGKLRYEYRRVEAGAALLGMLEPNKAGLLAIVKAADVEKATTALPAGTPVRTSFVDKKTAAHLDQASRQIG
ncbi:MAG TPA: hypothetical protein VHK05_03655 [Candidatus Limnocylindrales bacterium]|jgi:uncharacterized membrane protein|nr:hypothetical protein [Candidatus Limnocylindrales bacterium]